MDANQGGNQAGATPAPDNSDELLSKADALLSRYRPSGMAPSARELAAAEAPAATAIPSAPDAADFPVLTEVVELPGSRPEAMQDLPPLPEIHAPYTYSPAPGTIPAPAAGPGAGIVDQALEYARLREEILATLAPDLEQRLSDTLKPRANELLDWAMQTVQLELGLSIRAAVRSAVATAVDEALEKRRSDTPAE